MHLGPNRSPARARAGAACALAALALWAAGCERGRQAQFVSAPEIADLEPELQEAVRQQLDRLCGTPARPKSLSGPAGDERHLQHGAEVYTRNCAQCHGASGDGEGPAAQYLSPRPRDYRKGVFKFNSTGYGNKPRREDLVRIVQQGIVGTSMPSFDRMPKRDLDAAVDYVMALSQRGELETLLIMQAESDGELTDEMADELAEIVVDQWRSAADLIVEPATKAPRFDAESVAAGAEIFQKRECFKCHGRDGRGGLAGGIEVGRDAWGQVTAAADLTSGMLRGGQEPIDVYRRIYAGINGTPMPAFKDLLADEPEAVWHLTHYVLHLADQRRRGVQIPLAKSSGEVGAESSVDGASPGADATEADSEEETP